MSRAERLQLIAGVARAVAEHGYARLSVEQVIAAAGVSQETFYENFDNRQQAVLAAYDVVFERYLDALRRACSGEQEWPQKVRAAVSTTIDFAVEESDQARLLALDALVGDAEVTKRVLGSSDELAALLSTGREDSPRGATLPAQTEKALVGAVSALIAGRLARGETASLPELEPQIVELILTPYVGAEEASRVARASR